MILRTALLLTASAAGLFAANADTGSVGDVTWKMVTLKKSLPGCEKSPKVECASVDLAYPMIASAKSEQAKAKINQDIQDILLTPIEKGTSPTTPDEFATQILEHYQSWVKKGGNPKSTWSVDRKIDVNYHSVNVFGVRLLERVEHGNQHAAKNTVYFNFRPNDGRVIALTDVIPQQNLEKFGDIAEGKYQKKSSRVHPGEDPQKPDNEEEGQDEGGFGLPKNFAIEKEGLRFRYEEDQPDPHSIRTPEFVVRYAEIRKLMNPEIKIP
jgi:hypothetical protein